MTLGAPMPVLLNPALDAQVYAACRRSSIAS